MKSYVEKREVLCDLAEFYLNIKEDDYISVNDGIINSTDFDSISFLMLMALTYPKEEAMNIYSIDTEVTEDIRNSFVETEYSKIVKLKEDKISLGKIVLADAKKFYEKNYCKQDDNNIDQISNSFKI